MLVAYTPQGTSLDRQVIPHHGQLPGAAVWIDLINPEPDEDKQIERLFGVIGSH